MKMGVGNPTIQSHIQLIVEETVGFFIEVQKDLLPTPNRPTYIFNPRDVAKVF